MIRDSPGGQIDADDVAAAIDYGPESSSLVGAFQELWQAGKLECEDWGKDGLWGLPHVVRLPRADRTRPVSGYDEP